ncbi:MAG: HAD domain-containing protein [Candidatus Omnitrophica bacterium]|jgi:hypothetical protein|nr:HAD domain-containing protein [Candidatus Omnitrophota bacterium]
MLEKYKKYRSNGILKVAFIDIDGCLNNGVMYYLDLIASKSKKRNIRIPNEFKQLGGSVGKKHPYNELDKRNIMLLNNLIRKSKCKLVISSAWRMSMKYSIKSTLYKAGVIRGSIIGITPSLGKGSVRGNEIRQWIKDNEKLIGCYSSEYKNYVILDDDSDMLLWQQNNYIKVDGWCGITLNNVYKANFILNN